jgi:hypothetical protein
MRLNRGRKDIEKLCRVALTLVVGGSYLSMARSTVLYAFANHIAEKAGERAEVVEMLMDIMMALS